MTQMIRLDEVCAECGTSLEDTGDELICPKCPKPEGRYRTPEAREKWLAYQRAYNKTPERMKINREYQRAYRNAHLEHIRAQEIKRARTRAQKKRELKNAETHMSREGV